MLEKVKGTRRKKRKEIHIFFFFSFSKHQLEETQEKELHGERTCSRGRCWRVYKVRREGAPLTHKWLEKRKRNIYIYKHTRMHCVCVSFDFFLFLFSGRKKEGTMATWPPSRAVFSNLSITAARAFLLLLLLFPTSRTFFFFNVLGLFRIFIFVLVYVCIVVKNEREKGLDPLFFLPPTNKRTTKLEKNQMGKKRHTL